MSAPLPEGAMHLLVADDSLAEQHAYRCYLTLCGELMPTSSLPPSLCPDECERDHVFCLNCLAAATALNTESGQADRASEGVR